MTETQDHESPAHRTAPDTPRPGEHTAPAASPAAASAEASGIVVYGAGGRAGRAVVAEARRRGHRVTAVVRSTERHAAVAADGVDLVEGDITSADDVARTARGRLAAVHAVSPLPGPEIEPFDPEFFVKAADALLTGLALAGVPRLVAVGIFSALPGPDGRPLYEDPAAVPPPYAPFAAAHDAGHTHLAAAAGSPVDWLTLTPPAGLSLELPRTGTYLTTPDTPPFTATLSYADLAVALIDESENPRHHRTRLALHV
ncbi:NAD(P)-dependent oxidoreductase [Streptomyces sp. NPDC050560]|uniref:NAD(P)-dependent oxidoreductase n=1 Tax=Streptomyces sp. NPDC050560 TaxID=3365630 RepID=UPI00379154CA